MLLFRLLRALRCRPSENPAGNGEIRALLPNDEAVRRYHDYAVRSDTQYRLVSFLLGASTVGGFFCLRRIDGRVAECRYHIQSSLRENRATAEMFTCIESEECLYARRPIGRRGYRWIQTENPNIRLRGPSVYQRSARRIAPTLL